MDQETGFCGRFKFRCSWIGESVLEEGVSIGYVRAAESGDESAFFVNAFFAFFGRKGKGGGVESAGVAFSVFGCGNLAVIEDADVCDKELFGFGIEGESVGLSTGGGSVEELPGFEVKRDDVLV